MKSQHLLIVLFGASLYWMYRLYEPFLLTMLIAALLAISTANIQCYFTALTKSRFTGSLLTTFLLAILFFVPLGYFLANFTIKLNNLDPDILAKIDYSLRELIANPPSFLLFLKPYLVGLIKDLQIGDLASKALSYAGTIGSYSAGYLKNALMVIVFYFFAQFNGDAIIGFVKKVVKLPEDDNQLLTYELSSVMSTVFYSILATAMFEGALFGVAVSFMGYNGILFGIMYGFASLIPVVGGALMWLPFAVYEYSLGNTGAAIFIAVYSVVMISIIADTFIKPVIIKEINVRFIKSSVKLNELVIFFAIIAGLATFGFWGMILGPAITSFFLALLKLVEAKSVTV
ncbi:AI-2E family transporter [Sulfurimonas sp. HSL-1716]|uniref:AI-2E family transporter n=1 Tax=Hydrocurvibacter sulfurireducens TaxID=3131937 RepID=UPI0031F76818